MKLNKSYENGVLRAEIDGELDHHAAEIIRKELDFEIETKRVKKLIFDFKNVPFMDSSGIGVVVGRYKKMEALGGKTQVVNICDQVDKILEMSGIKGIIECEREAVKR